MGKIERWVCYPSTDIYDEPPTLNALYGYSKRVDQLLDIAKNGNLDDLLLIVEGDYRKIRQNNLPILCKDLLDTLNSLVYYVIMAEKEQANNSYLALWCVRMLINEFIEFCEVYDDT